MSSHTCQPPSCSPCLWRGSLLQESWGAARASPQPSRFYPFPSAPLCTRRIGWSAEKIALIKSSLFLKTFWWCHIICQKMSKFLCMARTCSSSTKGPCCFYHRWGQVPSILTVHFLNPSISDCQKHLGVFTSSSFVSDSFFIGSTIRSFTVFYLSNYLFYFLSLGHYPPPIDAFIASWY